MVKLTPIVLDDYLMLILTVPLVDQSLHMNLYKVHNLPMLHPTLNMHVQYELEGSYLVTMIEGMFMTLPTALDVMFSNEWPFMHVQPSITPIGSYRMVHLCLVY